MAERMTGVLVSEKAEVRWLAGWVVPGCKCRALINIPARLEVVAG